MTKQAKTTEAPKFGYYIDLDERGEFRADVRNSVDKTVFEICVDGSEDCSNIFEDGYMEHKNDIDGLSDYLKDMGVIPKNGVLLSMEDFEVQAAATAKPTKKLSSSYGM